MDSLKWVSGHKTLSLHFHVFPQVPFLASGRQNSVMLCSSTKQACECTAKCIFSVAKGVWKAICWSVCAAEALWMQHLSLCQLFSSLLMGYDHSRLHGLWKKKEQLCLINVFLRTKHYLIWSKEQMFTQDWWRWGETLEWPFIHYSGPVPFLKCVLKFERKVSTVLCLLHKVDVQKVSDFVHWGGEKVIRAK